MRRFPLVTASLALVLALAAAAAPATGGPIVPGAVPAAAAQDSLEAVPRASGVADSVGDGSPAPEPRAVRKPPWEGPPPARVAFQSMALPGWGQAQNGAWLKGGAFLAAYAGMLGWAVALNQDKQDAVGRLNAAEPGSQDERDWEAEVTRLDDARNGKYWLAGLVMLLSMADAYVDAHLRGFDERIDAYLAATPEGSSPVLGLRVTLAWDAPGGKGR